MIKTQKRLRGVIAYSLIAAGILLLLLNVIGVFFYTTIEASDSRLLDDNPATVAEDFFWEHAYREENEPLKVYLQRLTELISRRMLLIDQQYTKPTLFENWILWGYARYIGYYEWSDTKKAIRLGGGYCSQHAIVFNNILREQDIQSRIIKLGGHVANEVLVEGKWKVYDSDYNVVFDASLSELENNPAQVYKAYVSGGRPEAEATHLQEMFATAADNWHYKKTRTYREEKYYLEVAALYLVWIIPLVLLCIGIAMRTRGRPEFSS